MYKLHDGWKQLFNSLARVLATRSIPRILFEFLKVSYVTETKMYLDGVNSEHFILYFEMAAKKIVT